MISSETQVAVRKTARAFAQDRVRPSSAAFEAAGGFPPELFAELSKLGLMAMTAPEDAGGAGADYLSYVLAPIEIAAADGALSTILQCGGMAQAALEIAVAYAKDRRSMDKSIIEHQAVGGYGYLEEFGVAKIYRDVRVCRIYEGTSDIQRMVIARAL